MKIKVVWSGCSIDAAMSSSGSWLALLGRISRLCISSDRSDVTWNVYCRRSRCGTLPAPVLKVNVPPGFACAPAATTAVARCCTSVPGPRRRLVVLYVVAAADQCCAGEAGDPDARPAQRGSAANPVRPVISLWQYTPPTDTTPPRNTGVMPHSLAPGRCHIERSRELPHSQQARCSSAPPSYLGFGMSAVGASPPSSCSQSRMGWAYLDPPVHSGCAATHKHPAHQASNQACSNCQWENASPLKSFNVDQPRTRWGTPRTRLGPGCLPSPGTPESC